MYLVVTRVKLLHTIDFDSVEKGGLDSLFRIFGLEFGNLGGFLGGNSSLTLVQGKLGRALEGLIRGEFLLLARGRILTDSLVDGFVKFLKTISLDISVDVRGKVLLVLLVIFLLEVFHVFTNVSTEDAFTVHVGIVFLAVTVVSRESLLGVRNVKTTIGGSLKGSEDTGSGGGRSASNIEKGTEGSLVVIDFLDVVGLVVVFGGNNFSVNFGVSLVNIIESNLLEQTTSTEETGAVGGGVVLQTDGKSVTSELGGLSLAEDAISIDQGVSDLANDLGVGETDNKTVLRRLVLVLVLGTQSLALTVIGLTLASASELDLITREVGLTLSLLNENLKTRKAALASLHKA